MQEATDIYKQLLLEHRDYHALNVYVALCYSKLDYFDVSSEILQTYLQQHPNSAAAVNLKACNLFKQYGGKDAVAEIKVGPSVDTAFVYAAFVYAAFAYIASVCTAVVQS